MLKQLKSILNSYTDEQLSDLCLWINSSDVVTDIIVSEVDIDLITDNSEIKVNNTIVREASELC